MRWLGTGIAITGSLWIVAVYVLSLPARFVVHVLDSSTAVPHVWIGRLSRVANLGRRYRAPVDTAISAIRAGTAIQAVSLWRATPQDLALLQPITPESLNAFAVSIPDANPTRFPPGTWQRTLLPLASRGLSAEQRAFLRSVARPLTDSLTVVITRAPMADIVGTRYALGPRPHEPSGAIALPVPYPSVFTRLAARASANAALALDAGRGEAAEAYFRQVISAGLLLWDDGPDLPDAVVGSEMVRRGLEGLIVLDSIRGDSAAANALRAELSAARKESRADSAAFGRTNENLDDRAIRLIASTDEPIGVKWSILRERRAVEGMRFCFRLVDSTDWHAWEDKFRRPLTRTASESRFFAWIADPPDRRSCAVALNGTDE